MSTHHLLMIEDDTRLAAMVGEYLTQSGFTVTHMADGESGLAALQDKAVDLVILDLMLPDIDGLEVCRRIRALPGPVARVPVLMLTAKGDPMDRIVGLELGADDYLPKPFEPRELLARIRAVLRRPVRAEEGADRPLAFEGWRLEAEARRLTDPAGAPVELTGGEFALLLTFVRSAGRILSRDQILENTHGPLAENFDRAVDLAVSRLRRKLERPEQAALIETVRGAGYRFRAAVRR